MTLSAAKEYLASDSTIISDQWIAKDVQESGRALITFVIPTF